MGQTYETNEINIGTSDKFDYHDSSFVNLKLNTSALMERFEAFLSSKKKAMVRGEDGRIYESYVQYSEPVVDDIGVNMIVSMVDTTANNHTVQASTKEEIYYKILADTRREFTSAIVRNRTHWGIKEKDMKMLIDTFLRFFKLFLSRTIDNKEREGMQPQFQSREVISQQPRGNPLRNFTVGGNS